MLRTVVAIRKSVKASIGDQVTRSNSTIETTHLMHLILDSKQPNPLFYSPIPGTAKNILDVGTGTFISAKDVADHFPLGKAIMQSLFH